MNASVWVHVGCLPQIHKQSCQQQERMVNTKVCKVNTCTSCVCTTFHGNACICTTVCVWWFDNVRMMSWWQTQDHIQLVAACHPTWLPLYQFMLVEIPGEVPEGSDVDTCCGSGRFRCRHLVSFWRVPVQIPVEVPGPGSFTIVQQHCMLVCVWLYPYDCMCMIVWQCAHDVIVKVTWLLELVTAYSPTWLPMYEFTCLMTTMQGLMVAFSSLKSGSSLFLIPQLAAGDVPFWNGAVKNETKQKLPSCWG